MADVNKTKVIVSRVAHTPPAPSTAILRFASIAASGMRRSLWLRFLCGGSLLPERNFCADNNFRRGGGEGGGICGR